MGHPRSSSDIVSTKPKPPQQAAVSRFGLASATAVRQKINRARGNLGPDFGFFVVSATGSKRSISVVRPRIPSSFDLTRGQIFAALSTRIGRAFLSRSAIAARLDRWGVKLNERPHRRSKLANYAKRRRIKPSAPRASRPSVAGSGTTWTVPTPLSASSPFRKLNWSKVLSTLNV